MRFTRLLVVAWCAAVLCASLGGALSLRPGTALQEDNEPPRRCIHDALQKNIWAPGVPRASATHATPARGARGAAPLADGDNWQPVRIRFFIEDLKDPAKYCTAVGETKPDFMGGTATCTEADILTPEKNDTLLNYLLPNAIALHGHYLQVQPLSNILVPTMTEETYCYYNTIPDAHHTAGVSDTDFVVYVSAGPTPAGIVAWAGACAAVEDGRPVIGTTHVSPRYITRDRGTVSTLAHELLHALGFSIYFFEERNMVSNVSVRGKPKSQVMNTPTVVAKAREHYGCATMTYMELEDEGGSLTASSHWERRNAKDELMAGVIGIGFYSPITIAAMEDTGFYKGNYTDAEFMLWGYQAGCKLLDEKCVINGVSQYPSMFTTNDTLLKCTSDRLSTGSFVTSLYLDLPEYYQYFSSPFIGGPSSSLMDICPYTQAYYNTRCADGDLSILVGSLTGSNARCIDVVNSPITAYDFFTIPAVCAEVQCGTNLSSYQVKFKGAADYVTCTQGATIDLHRINPDDFQTGTAVCPPRYEVCRETIREVLSSSDFFGSSSSQPVSSSSATAVSSSSQPQPIASSSSSHPVSSSSGVPADSSSNVPDGNNGRITCTLWYAWVALFLVLLCMDK